MNRRHTARVVTVLFAPLVLQACATKGYVKEHIASARLASDSALSTAIGQERDARIQGDAENAARITALRADLDSLRTQFGARIAVVEDGIRFAMPVTFAFDEATVNADDERMLERFARVAKTYYPSSVITIEGFADPAGSARYNLALSKRRAENVSRSLATLGLDRSQLRAVGYGETRLVTPGATHGEPGAERNRRVVFAIETGGAEAATIAMR